LPSDSAILTSSRNTSLPRVGTPKPAFTSSLLAILGGQAASGAVALLTEITYARLLGPAARGVISLCLMSMAFGSLLAGLGGEGVVVYWASRSHKKTSGWIPAVLFWGCLGCAVAGVLWILAYWQLHLPVLRGISPRSARVVLVGIPAAVLFAYMMALASGTERFRLRSACAALRQAVGITSFVFLVLLIGRNVEAALWGNLVGLAVGSLVALLLLRNDIRRNWRIDGTVEHLKATLSYGLRGQVGNLATFFSYRLDVFIVNYFLDPAQLGFYALGVVVSEALWQIPQAAASALFPRTARTVEHDATEFTCFILRQVLLITTLCGIAVAALSPFVIPVVFGARFGPSVPVIWWILPGTIALSLGKVACADLAGRGKNGYSSVFAFICLAVTAFLDWFLIPRMGIIGAAFASSIAYFLDALLILVALRHELRVSWRSVLIPARSDVEAYRLAWFRLRSALAQGLTKRVTPAEIFASPEGD